MCDERERLIEYVYGEGDPVVRQRVETHVAECHLCRAEVAGLRRVRDELLAWDVPKHEPIWRPVAVEPAVPPRRAVPVWALATAASAIFAAGLAGGIATRGWMAPEAGVPSAVVATAEPAMPPAAAVTSDDLARLEAVILERVRNEMSEQIRLATLAEPPPAAARVNVANRGDDIETRLAFIERLMDAQISLNNIYNGKFGSLNSQTSSLSEQIELSRLQRVGFEGSVR